MSSSSEASEPEELPQVPFLVPVKRQAGVIMVLSSDSDDDQLADIPLRQRLCPPAPRNLPGAPPRNTSSRDPPARPLGAAAPRNPPSRHLPAAPLVAAPLRGPASRDTVKVPQPKKGKKSLDVVTVHIDPGIKPQALCLAWWSPNIETKHL